MKHIVSLRDLRALPTSVHAQKHIIAHLNIMFTTKKTHFNVIKFKAVFKNQGRKISSGIIKIKWNFLKTVI